MKDLSCTYDLSIDSHFTHEISNMKKLVFKFSFQEHCLVGSKGSIPLNRGLDCDVIVAEVRATSHKPDEIYGIIERLSPGTRKIELFGRPHNVQPNWVTLGNQLDGVMIRDPEMFERWKKVYPEGYNIAENFILHPRQE